VLLAEALQLLRKGHTDFAAGAEAIRALFIHMDLTAGCSEGES
jgi:hypothetical protein